MSVEQTVFVVDDDEFMRNALGRVFRSSGFRVRLFDRAEGFLDGYVPGGEGCLILDLRMPGLGGLEVLERLRARHIDLPVIVYSGNADVPVTVRAMQAGAYSVLEKPFSNELLIERVREAIAVERKRRAQRERIADACARLGTLTGREGEIAAFLAKGLSAPQIAARLKISARTVEAHRANVLRKLDVSSIAALAQLMLLTEMGDD